MAFVANFPQLAGSQTRLLAGGGGDELRDRLGVLAVQQLRRHAALTRAADLDRAQDAALGDRPDLVEIRAGHTPGVDRVEVVTGGAGAGEQRLALAHLRAAVTQLLRRQRRGIALAVTAGRDDDRRYG